MPDVELFWIETQFDIPSTIDIPEEPDVWSCDMGGFHAQRCIVGWTDGVGEHFFAPFLLVRTEVLIARFCQDCCDWLDRVFDLRNAEPTQLSGGDDHA